VKLTKNTQLNYADTRRLTAFHYTAPQANCLQICSLKIKFSFLNANLMVATAPPPMCRWTISVN
jgi:hypothetical protein